MMCDVPLSVFMKELGNKDWKRYNEQYLFAIKTENGYKFSTYKLRVGEEHREEASVSVSFVYIDNNIWKTFYPVKSGDKYIEMATRGIALSRYLSITPDKDIVKYC